MKNVMRTLLVIGMLMVISSTAQANLLLHWTFDDAVGSTTVADAANGYTGIAGGTAPTFGEAGVAGTAAYFNGTTDWMQLPYTTDLVNTSFTVSFWINESTLEGNLGLTGHQQPLGFGSTHPEYPNVSGQDQEGGWAAFHRSGSPTGRFDPRLGNIRDWSDNADQWTNGGAVNLTRNTGWHHIVMTVEAIPGAAPEVWPNVGTENEYTYYRVNRATYVDGDRTVSVSTDPEENILYMPGPIQEVPLSIGARVENMDAGVPVPNTFFNGFIDDVQYYTNALSAEEVAYLYANPGIAVPEPATLTLLALGGVAFLRRRRA